MIVAILDNINNNEIVADIGVLIHNTDFYFEFDLLLKFLLLHLFTENFRKIQDIFIGKKNSDHKMESEIISHFQLMSLKSLILRGIKLL